MCNTDIARAQTPVAARSPRGTQPPFRRARDGKTPPNISQGENAPQASRLYPNAARDRPRCRRVGRGGQPRAAGARTECHGVRGAPEPSFFPLEMENSTFLPVIITGRYSGETCHFDKMYPSSYLFVDHMFELVHVRQTPSLHKRSHWVMLVMQYVSCVLK